MRPRWLPHLPSRITILLALVGPLALLLAIVSVRANQNRGLIRMTVKREAPRKATETMTAL